MKAKTEAAVADRRNFLKFAGASAVGAGVVAGTPAAPAEAAATGSKAASNDLYRETAHVKRYYELAR